MRIFLKVSWQFNIIARRLKVFSVVGQAMKELRTFL